MSWASTIRISSCPMSSAPWQSDGRIVRWPRSDPPPGTCLIVGSRVMPVVDNAIYIDGRREVQPDSMDRTFSELRACPGDGHSFCWIGLLHPDPDEIHAVAEEFNLHKLAVEDTITAHQRPKLERYDDILFVVLRPVRYVDSAEAIEIGELHLFLGPDFVITVRHAEEPDLRPV